MKPAFEFNFDEWVELAKQDPEAFAQRRDTLVKETCERMDESIRPAIEGICWRIDIERQRSNNPMQLCLKLSSLMWGRHSDMTDRLSDLNISNQNLQSLLQEQRRKDRAAEKSHLRLVEVVPPSDKKV